MATHTPIFSAVRICRFQRIFHGKTARHTSIIADHTAWNRPYTTDGCLLMHWPGMKSTKVFASGVHCTHGMIVAGIAKIAKVEIAKYTKSRTRPSVNRSKVRPKEILLRAIATVYIVSSAAPMYIILSTLRRSTGIKISVVEHAALLWRLTVKGMLSVTYVD
jgi:hypothetical protein